MIRSFSANTGTLRGVLFVRDDGLVTLYGGPHGTYGYYWPGEQAFGPDGIIAFLAMIDVAYAVDKLTFHLHAPKKSVKDAETYIMAIWPSLTAELKDTKNVGAS